MMNSNAPCFTSGCLFNGKTTVIIGTAPRARGGRQTVYGCTQCGGLWIRTAWGWTYYDGELLPVEGHDA